ncbi:hypothetical protein HUC00_28665 [Bacillus mycoides]|nr:hypothetical protein [Bacillus mycoides]
MSTGEFVSVKSVLNELAKKGQTLATVSRDIVGIGSKKLSSILNELGYVHVNEGEKGWHFKGEGQEPLDENILDYVTRRSPKVISSNTKEDKSNKDVNESNTKVERSSTGFTDEEIQEIRLMLEERRNNQTVSALHDRIKQINQDEKTRKTIVLDKQLGERLDKFCKSERVNKSDVLHLAITDFLERY